MTAHAGTMAFGSVPNLSNYGHIFIHFVYLLWYLRQDWVVFIHVWYSNQLPCVTDAYIKYNLAKCQIWVIMPIIFLKFYVCCNISENNVFIIFIFDTIINHSRDLMHVKYTLALCQNVPLISIYHNFCMFVVIYQWILHQWILFMLGTTIIETLCT